jgi:hypothetical protein
MSRSTLFWGVILILIGALLLLNNLGVLDVNVWSLIWPLFLIALGLRILWGVVVGPRSVEAEEIAIPLEGAGRARVRIRHGAGRLHVSSASASPGALAAGTFGGGLDHRVRRDGDTLDVEMRVPSDGFPHFVMPWNWGAGGALDCSFGLNSEIPLSLDLETGASDTRLDLTDLRVTDLRLKTGASATDLTLPANAGHTRVDIGAGAASVNIRVPSGVATRILVKGSLAGINVDTSRFPRMGDTYQSTDYDTAPNKVDIDIETGVGSIYVR